MSNTHNRMIVFVSILLGAILATSILALNPSTITNAQAMPYDSEDYDDRHFYGDQYGDDRNYYQDNNRYGYDSNYYYQEDNRYSYDNNHPKKISYGDIQKIKCVNSNINVNGIDITEIPQDTTATAAAANEGAGADATGAQNGNGWADKINFNRNLVNICVNVNVNEQVKVTPPEEPEPPTCEDCFADLSETQINRLLEIVQAASIGAYCDRLLDTPNSCEETENVAVALESVPEITEDQIDAIIQCLVGTGVIQEVCPA